MAKFRDLTNCKFGRLTVLRRAENGIRAEGGTLVRWLCRCDCGNLTTVARNGLTHGGVKSCGCLQSEMLSKLLTTHGHTKNGPTREYLVWADMKTRCYNPNTARFKHYGGRGISVCERWSRFENFLEDMGNRPSPKHSLHRKDNDGNYEPSNCEWALRKTQDRNKTTNHRLTIKGITKCLIDWCEESGISHNALSNRLRRGWEPEIAVFKPLVNLCPRE